MFFIDIIGLYAFLYPLICIIATLIIRQVYRHIVTVMMFVFISCCASRGTFIFFASLISLTISRDWMIYFL